MARIPWSKIGDPVWYKMMSWGWGIYTLQYQRGKRYPIEFSEPWIALDADRGEYHSFATHAEASAYVRSQIDKAQST